MEVIKPEGIPPAIGPYSEAIKANGFVFLTGQVGVVPKTGELVGNTIEEQTEQALKNLGVVLKAAGSSYEKVYKTTCYLADMADFAKFNAVYEKYLVGKPARSCVAVKSMAPGYLVEIVCDAICE